MKIAFLLEGSVSACRVLHSWEQRNEAVRGGDRMLVRPEWNEYLEVQNAIQVTL